MRLEEMKKIAKDLNITINATSINNINDKNTFQEKISIFNSGDDLSGNSMFKHENHVILSSL